MSKEICHSLLPRLFIEQLRVFGDVHQVHARVPVVSLVVHKKALETRSLTRNGSVGQESALRS